eukprot:3365298-Rhodomonas_salina.5
MPDFWRSFLCVLAGVCGADGTPRGQIAKRVIFFTRHIILDSSGSQETIKDGAKIFKVSELEDAYVNYPEVATPSSAQNPQCNVETDDDPTTFRSKA